MNKPAISPDISVLHANIVKAPYFEGFWTMQKGVSINSFLIKAEKTVLIDLYGEWENSPEQIEQQVLDCGVKIEDIDYLIINHMENDHAGSVPEYMARNKKLQVFGTTKTMNLLKKFANLNETDWNRLSEVKTGDSLDLGKGQNSGETLTLEFYETPNVHWPETMMTFETKTKTLFSCDGFGSYNTMGSRVFDNDYSHEELVEFEKAALYYYANIISSFGTAVKNALKLLKTLNIKTIAPSHGLVWRQNPKRIMELYENFSGYNTGGKQENRICLISGSMYGNTRLGTEAVAEGIKSAGLDCCVLDIPETPTSQVVGEAFGAKGLVLAFPTYEYKMYPPAAWILDIFNRKHFFDKTVLRIGSWGWSGGAQREYEQLTANLRWTQLDSLEWQGVPDQKVLASLKERGRELAEIIKAS